MVKISALLGNIRSETLEEEGSEMILFIISMMFQRRRNQARVNATALKGLSLPPSGNKYLAGWLTAWFVFGRVRYLPVLSHHWEESVQGKRRLSYFKWFHIVEKG